MLNQRVDTEEVQKMTGCIAKTNIPGLGKQLRYIVHGCRVSNTAAVLDSELTDFRSTLAGILVFQLFIQRLPVY